MQKTTEFGYDSKIEGDLVVTRRDAAVGWFRKQLDAGAKWGAKIALWPMPMGLACCAIELMAAGAARFDIARFGAEVMRFSPRQSDVMIVAGTVTYKMALAVKRIYDQMPEPKWVIAMGACASSGGMYRSYPVLQGIDRLLPVDIYGNEPRFEIVYELYSFTRGQHLRLKFSVSEDDPQVATVSDIWATANWHEREIYDMMGIKFAGHPDLRRILMWDGYPYFPLRKDFPLAGLPSEMPDVAFTKITPLEGGPFVTIPSTAGSKDREPRARES